LARFQVLPEFLSQKSIIHSGNLFLRSIELATLRRVPKSSKERSRMYSYNLHGNWPSAEELPDSDETPVDNELQDLIPHLLKTVLAWIWAERDDWFFGIEPDETA
jgi:hypothetical protein